MNKTLLSENLNLCYSVAKNLPFVTIVKDTDNQDRLVCSFISAVNTVKRLEEGSKDYYLFVGKNVYELLRDSKKFESSIGNEEPEHLGEVGRIPFGYHLEANFEVHLDLDEGRKDKWMVADLDVMQDEDLESRIKSEHVSVGEIER